MGERAMALSRLTLRVTDPANGGSSDILLPAGRARLVHPRRRAPARSYQAELGLTLPSGEFRPPGREQHRRDAPRRPVPPSARAGASRSARRAGSRQDAASRARDEELRSVGRAAGPWRAPSVDGAAPEATATRRRPPVGARTARLGAGRRERRVPAGRRQRRLSSLGPLPAL